jgi:hypothetical protein
MPVQNPPPGNGNIPDGSITTDKLADGAVTLAKVQNIGANTFLGNGTGSAAAPQALTADEMRALLRAPFINVSKNNSQDLNVGTPTTIVYNTPKSHEFAGTYFDFNAGTGEITLKKKGEYKVSTNTNWTSGNNARKTVATRAFVGATPVPETLCTGYSRNTIDNHGTASMSDATVITTAVDQVLTVRSEQRGSGGAAPSIANSCFVYVEFVREIP